MAFQRFETLATFETGYLIVLNRFANRNRGLLLFDNNLSRRKCRCGAQCGMHICDQRVQFGDWQDVIFDVGSDNFRCKLEEQAFARSRWCVGQVDGPLLLWCDDCKQ